MIIPALDVYAGRCVRLIRGDPEMRLDYGDPLNWLREFHKYGAPRLHMVNLDGAFGNLDSWETMQSLVKRANDTGFRVQVGGGVRNAKLATDLLNLGVDKVMLGSMVIEDASEVRRLVERWGPERIIAALDAREERIVVRGWRQLTALTLEEALRMVLETGIRYVLVTDVERDGTMAGKRSLLPPTSARIIGAGGISSTDDLRLMASLGYHAAVVGRAIYEGAIGLEDLEGLGWRVDVD